jgi:hypothetical protein
VPAREEDYDGVRYEDMVFESVDWSEIGDHDPARRSIRKGSTEKDIAPEWATEACQDPRRFVRSAGSKTGMTVRVTGWSPSANCLVTVIVAPKDSPPGGDWWGATAWETKAVEAKTYREGER